VATTKEKIVELEHCYWMMGVAWLLFIHHHLSKVLFPILLDVKHHPPNYLPLGCCPKLYMMYHHNPAHNNDSTTSGCSVHKPSFLLIESVSSHIMDEAIGAPTPLCRRSIYNL